MIFLDLDDTLYPRTNGLWQAIGGRILEFMTRRVGMAAGEAEERRAEYLDRYGTTLSGLIRHHSVDPLEYLRFVHDLPLETYLAPDPRLRDVLANLTCRRAIFTNAHREYVERVVERLGVADVLDQIIDLLALQLHPKPEPEAYRLALALTGDPPPDSCVLVDDRARNLLPAAGLGMHTILVGAGGGDGIARTIDSIYELPAVLDRGG
ncbi:MAG: pyrimidine 5'-nucleotidase [Anaerolineales bacterium]